MFDSQVVPYAFWDSPRLKAFLDEMNELYPESEGAWIDENIFYACVFKLELNIEFYYADEYFTFEGRNFYRAQSQPSI